MTNFKHCISIFLVLASFYVLIYLALKRSNIFTYMYHIPSNNNTCISVRKHLPVKDSICYVEDPQSDCKLEARDIFKDVNFNLSASLRDFFGMDRFKSCPKGDYTKKKYPALVTAASSNHFEESQGLLKSIDLKLQHWPNMTVLYYDIGLSYEQRFMLEAYCKFCELRTFPFSELPKHVSIVRGYSWKPLVIQMALMEYDFVMWMDACVRIADVKKLDELLAKTRKRHIQHKSANARIRNMTDVQTFAFLKQDMNFFKNYRELDAKLIVLSRTEFLMEQIMHPWISCALTFGCMITNISQIIPRNCVVPQNFNGSQTICHRWEQSVMGILLSRIYPNNRECVTFTIKDTGVELRGGRGEAYFPHLVYSFTTIDGKEIQLQYYPKHDKNKTI